MARKKISELTLSDRLSRLTFTEACKLLGATGKELIMEGGSIEIANINDQVHFDQNCFQLEVRDGVGKIAISQDQKRTLQFSCTKCPKLCIHIGAAVSFVLEEKLFLGLAKPPKERVPIESMTQEELVKYELEKRSERAQKEKMRVVSNKPNELWSDYTVTNSESGRSYRVALRGWENGESYCTCPDFRKNTLGTCKHILYTSSKMKKKFPPKDRNKPYKRKQFSIYLLYGKSIQLKLGVPESLPTKIKSIIKNVDIEKISNPKEILATVKKLEQNGFPVNIYPDASEHIEYQLNQSRLLNISEEIRKDPKNHPLRKKLLKVELLPHQMDGIAFVAGANRAILADDMGLGKTIQAIGSAELLAQSVGISKVLVVCPTSLKSQWISEIERFSNRSSQLIIGSYKDRPQQYENDCFFTVCNYEQLRRDLLFVKNLRWDFIIVDEAQRIKNWEAQTTRQIKELNSPYALALTGTPLENRLSELYSIVEFVDNRHLGPAFQFFNRHNVTDKSGRILSYKNLNELREKLVPILLRRTRGLVMKDLPSRIDQIIRIPATEEQIEFNRGQMMIVKSIISKSYITEMDLMRLQKALLLARMNADSTQLISKLDVGFSSKLEKICDLLDQIKEDPTRKCVLFSEWTKMLDIIEIELKKRKIQFVRLDGKIPQIKRKQIVDKFNKDANCTFFLTTNAGSTGLNLQVANTVINVDLPWNPAVLEQRIARAHRMGQKRKVHVYILVSDGTIEENMLGTLASKKKLSLAALDFNSDVNEVSNVSGLEELKGKLEELLGAEPEVALDASAKAEQEKMGIKQKEQVSVASGNLLTAMFELMGSLIPPTQGSNIESTKSNLQNQLINCIEKDEKGRPTLKITLPNEGSIGSMAHVLAMMSNNMQGSPVPV